MDKPQVPTDEGSKAGIQVNRSCLLSSCECSYLSEWGCNGQHNSSHNASFMSVNCESPVNEIGSLGRKAASTQVHVVEFNQMQPREIPDELDLLYQNLNWDELNYSQTQKRMKVRPEEVSKEIFPMVIHRKQRMNQIALPKCDSFTISPSMDELTKMNPSRLKRVWGVRIGNQFGQVRFMEPISLLGKDIDRILTITSEEVAIADRKWARAKVQLIFEDFAHYSSKSAGDRKNIIANLGGFARFVSMTIHKFNPVTGKLFLVEK